MATRLVNDEISDFTAERSERMPERSEEAAAVICDPMKEVTWPAALVMADPTFAIVEAAPLMLEAMLSILVVSLDRGSLLDF